jgi:ankyrin repeat protein
MSLGDDPNRPLKKVAYFAWENDLIESTYTPWKPLHMASLFGFDASRIPVAECLIKHGADVNAVSPLDGFRPIHLVTMPNRVDLIRFYVANGVDVDSRSVECQGLDISECNRGPCSGTHDRTPLMVACGEGFIEAVKCLLDLGANVNARNSAGQTPLHFAARRFWPKRPYDAIIDVLLSRGADKNALDDVGRSP